MASNCLKIVFYPGKPIDDPSKKESKAYRCQTARQIKLACNHENDLEHAGCKKEYG